MPAARALLSLSSAAVLDGIEATITVYALLPGGQPVMAGGGVAVVVVGAAPAGAPPVAPAGPVAPVGAGVAPVVGVSDGAAPATVCVGDWALVLPASFEAFASANATPAPASSTTIPTIAAGRRQLGGRW